MYRVQKKKLFFSLKQCQCIHLHIQYTHYKYTCIVMFYYVLHMHLHIIHTYMCKCRHIHIYVGFFLHLKFDAKPDDFKVAWIGKAYEKFVVNKLFVLFFSLFHSCAIEACGALKYLGLAIPDIWVGKIAGFKTKVSDTFFSTGLIVDIDAL